MAQFTREAIAREFRRQLETRPADDITVRGLVTALGINPKTFYYHFHSIPDLVLWYLYEDLKRAVGGRYHTTDWEEGVLGIMAYVAEQRRMFRALVVSKYWPELRSLLIDLYKDAFIYRLMDDIADEFTAADGRPFAASAEGYRIAADLWTMIYYSLLESWFLNGMKEKPEDYLKTYTDIFGYTIVRDNLRLYQIS